MGILRLRSALSGLNQTKTKGDMEQYGMPLWERRIGGGREIGHLPDISCAVPNGLRNHVNDLEGTFTEPVSNIRNYDDGAGWHGL